MDIRVFREQHPEYNDLTDHALASRLHQKFYSDMEFPEFAQKFGYEIKTLPLEVTPQGLQQPEPVIYPPEPKMPALQKTDPVLPPLQQPPQLQPMLMGPKPYDPRQPLGVVKGLGQRIPYSATNIGAGAIQSFNEGLLRSREMAKNREAYRALDTRSLLEKAKDSFIESASDPRPWATDPEALKQWKQRRDEKRALEPDFDTGQWQTHPAVTKPAKIGKDARAVMEMIRQDATQGDPVAQFLYDAGAAGTDMIPALVAGWTTKNPKLTLGIMSAQAGFGTYGPRRDAGENPAQAAKGMLYTAIVEGLTEKIPVERAFKLGTPFVKRLLEVTVGEALQEGASAALQAAYDKGTIRPDMTWNEALKEIGYETAIGGVIGPGMTAGGHVAGKAHEGIDRFKEYRALDKQLKGIAEQQAVEALQPQPTGKHVILPEGKSQFTQPLQEKADTADLQGVELKIPGKTARETLTETPQELTPETIVQEPKQPEPVKPKTEKPKPIASKQAARLRKAGDTLTKQIQAKRHPATADQNPTPRRARIIERMAKEADQMERQQSILYGLADGIESGKITGPAAKITSKAEVQTVLGRDKLPDVRLHPRDISDLLDSVKGLRGVTDARNTVKSLEHMGEVTITRSEQISAVDTLLKAGDKQGKKVLQYSFVRDSVKDYNRIKKLGIEDQSQWNEVRETVKGLAEAKPKETTKEQEIKQIERDLIGNKIPGFFATPEPVIDRMMDEADIESGMKVLEPSAGAGDIAAKLQEAGGDVSTIEINPTLSDLLQKKGFNVADSDFLAHKKKYDRIVMNPPFEKMADVDHVRHAFDLLNPGGRVVAIVSESPFFRSDKKAQEFRDFVDEHGYSEELPEGAFKKGRFRSTGVKSRLVVLDKPEKTLSSQTLNWNPGEQYASFLNTAAIPEPATVPDKVYRRDDILKKLSKRIGMPIYTGRVKGKTLLGFYRPQIDEIRLKRRNDLEVTAHEVAHFIDYNNPEIKRAYRSKAFKDEVRSVSYDATKLHEGFAEFVRLWATQETEAVQRAPKFYEWWENWVSTNKKFGPALLEAKADIKAWYDQGALNRLKSKIGKPEKHIGEKLLGYADRFTDKAIGNIVDGLQGLKSAEKDLMGQIENANASPYKSMRNVAGARGVVKMILQEGTPGMDSKGNLYFTGEGLKQVLEPVHNKLEDWAAYMVARRAMELSKQGREKLITPEEIRAGLKLGQDPDILNARNKFKAFNKRMMDFYEQLEILNPESRKAIEAANEEYIPFNRVIEAFDSKKPTKAGDPMKRLHGSDRNIEDVVDSIASNVAVMVHRGLENKAKLLAYNMVAGKGGAKYATKIPKDSKKIKIPVEEVRRAFLNSLGLTPSMMELAPVEMQHHFDWMFSGMKDVAQFWVHGQSPAGDNIDSVMRKGKLEYYEVADPLFFKAMNHYGSRSMNLAIRVMGGAKSVLTRGVTSMPDFMAANIVRDAAMGYMLSKSGMKPFIGSAKGLINRMLHDPAYKEFILNGGGYASTIQGETKAMKRDLEKIYEEAGIDIKSVLDTPEKLLNAWDEVNSAFEYATRLEEYKNLRKKGVSAKEATFQSRDITTDFAMRGYSDTVRFFTTTVPFLNAGMQGLYRLGRAFSGKDVVKNDQGQVVGQTNPIQLTVKALTTITIPSLLLHLLNSDDERYQELPDWIRDLHWVVFIPGKEEPYLIPKPFEVGGIFASIPERTLDLYKDKDGKKYKDSLLWILANQFRLEPWRIQAITPIVETEGSNRNFTGAPIIPEDLKDVEAFEQFDPYTTNTAVALGKELNISPKKIDHWVRGYFGYLGTYGLEMSDLLINSPYGDKPEKKIDQYPVLRRFTRTFPLRSTRYQTDFYELVNESRKVLKTFDKMNRELRPDEAAEYLKKEGHETAVALGKNLNDFTKEVSDIRSTIRMIAVSKTKNAKEKREEIDNLQTQLNTIFKQASKALSSDEFKAFRDTVKRRR